MTVAVVAALFLAAPLASGSPTPAERFRQAGELVRSGDALKGIAVYRQLAASGVESAALYWNWAQAAAARGEVGESLWALVRARELDPGDRALDREIERLRDVARLDPAEVDPEPLAALARTARRLRLGLLSLVLAGVSLLAHAAARRGFGRAASRAALIALLLAALLGVAPLAGGSARPTAVVVTKGAGLLDAASPTAGRIGALRQGEVVPILESSGGYLRIEDSSGARGWAHADDVWPIAAVPAS